MLKDVSKLNAADPFYSGAAGFVSSTLEQLHEDMRRLELPPYVPDDHRGFGVLHNVPHESAPVRTPQTRRLAWRKI
jgi:hypothetical protein